MLCDVTGSRAIITNGSAPAKRRQTPWLVYWTHDDLLSIIAVAATLKGHTVRTIFLSRALWANSHKRVDSTVGTLLRWRRGCHLNPTYAYTLYWAAPIGYFLRCCLVQDREEKRFTARSGTVWTGMEYRHFFSEKKTDPYAFQAVFSGFSNCMVADVCICHWPK